MKKIIVPVDFSTTSENAAEFAGNLAIFYDAEILLYHAYEVPVAIAEITYQAFDIAETQRAADHELLLVKDALQDKLRSKVTIKIMSELAPFTEGMVALCETENPDLVVIGLSGKDALTKLIVGSNTVKLMHLLKYPILIVPPKAAFTPVRKIGFACDYKQIEKNTPVDLLKKMVTDFNAELHIINVDFNNRNFTPDTVNESYALKEMFKKITPIYSSIESESVTEGLNNYADETGLDWIVMIPKKHTLLQKLFSRSHSKEMLYHTHLPVLCVHQ